MRTCETVRLIVSCYCRLSKLELKSNVCLVDLETGAEAAFGAIH